MGAAGNHSALDFSPPSRGNRTHGPVRFHLTEVATFHALSAGPLVEKIDFGIGLVANGSLADHHRGGRKRETDPSFC